MNKSIMMGRVVNEPDLRYTQTENGELAIANFRLAVNRKFVRRGDPEADFFSCTAFGRKAEFAEKYLFKGIKILVEGRMQNDNYKNRAGENVYGMRLMIEGDQILAGQDPEELRQEAGSVVRILMTGTWKQMMKNWILTEQIIGGNAYDRENEQMVVCT